jgi:PhzF family phenazine biosynthesis protein
MKFWQVDSFTKNIFSGNPAAVFCLENSSDLSDEQMQKIALEMNLSETVFVWPTNDNWGIRWFTPGSEVDLCGHATLAAAHILWQQGYTKNNTVNFHSQRSGQLSATKKDEKIWLNFPKQPAQQKTICDNAQKLSIGNKILFFGSNSHDAVMVFDDESKVLSYQPDYQTISLLPERGFIVTAKGKTYDYIYRAFFPKLGLTEDPVTGSANTLLAPYWAKNLNKNFLTAYQASPRGGEVLLDLQEDRVLIGGDAVTVFEGKFNC